MHQGRRQLRRRLHLRCWHLQMPSPAYHQHFGSYRNPAVHLTNGMMLVLLYKAQVGQLSIHLQRILTVQQVVQIVGISIWLLLRHSVELCDENEILLLEKLCNTSCFGLKQSVCANGWVCVRRHNFFIQLPKQ